MTNSESEKSCVPCQSLHKLVVGWLVGWLVGSTQVIVFLSHSL